MEDKKKKALQKLMSIDYEKMDQMYICTKCFDIIDDSIVISRIYDKNGKHFLSMCILCDEIENRENERKKEIERLKSCRERYRQMKYYLENV